MFCKKCKSLLIPKKNEKTGKIIFVCRNCGRASREKSLKIIKTKPKKEKLFFVDKKHDETMPKTRQDCPKCPSRTAYYWIIQTRAADEPPTKFFKCVKCGHVWRDYS